MPNIKKTLSAFALSLLVALSAGGFAVAQQGSDDSSSSNVSSSSGSGSSGSGETKQVYIPSTHREAQVSVSSSGRSTIVEDSDNNSTETEIHKRGSDDAAKLRGQHKSSKSAEERKKVCEAHKQGLERKFSRIVTNSQRIQTRIDGVLDKAVKYQADNNITVDNFDELVAKANAAKTKASDSITTLESVKPSLDCNNVSVADDVAAFKAAAGETRDNLKAYRTAVKAVLKALHDAKTTDTTDTEGSN